MSYNYTGMDIFDRGFEPMCYCTNNSFKEATIDALNQVSNINVASAQDVYKVIFSSWHIKRRDLLTLRG